MTSIADCHTHEIVIEGVITVICRKNVLAATLVKDLKYKIGDLR